MHRPFPASGLNARLLWLAMLASLTSELAGQAAPSRKTCTTELASSGAWCWFQDPRAVYFEGKYRRTYVGWITLTGDVQVASIDADTGKTLTATLREKLQPDDHDNPVIHITPDGYVTVFYSKHNGPDLFYRRSLGPESIEQWGPEQTIPTNTRGRYGFTYYHPMRLSEEGGKTYLFWRGGNWQPTFSITMDGKTWTEARNLLMSNEPRPYLKVCSNFRDSIHFAYTSGDPRPEETKVTSLFYAVYRNGALYRADGARICALDEAPFAHAKGHLLWDHEATGHRAWVWDIALDAEEKPVVVFATFPDPDDHRYHYARWDGKKWNIREVTRSSGGFTLALPDGTRKSPRYAGGITLNHSDPSVVYVSARRAGVFEIEKWTTPDRGKTWSSQAVTSGSKKNNVRPVVPWGFNGRGVEVLWMHGDYYHYSKQYHTAIHLRALKPQKTNDKMEYRLPPPLHGAFEACAKRRPFGRFLNRRVQAADSNSSWAHDLFILAVSWARPPARYWSKALAQSVVPIYTHPAIHFTGKAVTLLRRAAIASLPGSLCRRVAESAGVQPRRQSSSAMILLARCSAVSRWSSPA